MTTRHTAEPWTLGVSAKVVMAGDRRIAVCDDLIDRFSSVADKANAARIVACVNACAGMADPEREIEQLLAEVERLREALQTVAGAWDAELAEIARAALTTNEE